jgi:MFS family permease
MVRPFASYRALEIGMAPSALGLISATYAIAPVFLALSIGRLVDRRGELPFLLGALILHGGGAVTMVVFDDALALLGSVAVVGAGQLVAVVALQTMIGSRTPRERYDARFGSFAFFISVGHFTGPLVAGALATQVVTLGGTREAGTATALLFGASLSLVALPTLAAIRRTDPGSREVRTSPSGSSESVVSILRTPGMLPMLLASMAVLATMDVITVYLPAIGEERGMAVATVGAILAARAGASMVSRLVLGRLVAWFGRGRLIIGSMAISAAAISALGFLPVEGMFVAMAIVGAALGVGQPITTSWVAAHAAPWARGTAMSIRLLGNRLGQVVIPVGAGLVAVVGGTSGVLAAMGLTVAVSSVVVWIGSRDD